MSFIRRNRRGLLRAPMVLAGVAAAALVVLVALQGGQGLLRMILPWGSSPYTSLALEGPEGPLAEGRPFTLTARVSGVPVGKVTLYRQGSPDPLAEAAPDAQGLVRLTVDGLDGPADFVARGGDGQSDPLRIEITRFRFDPVACVRIGITDQHVEIRLRINLPSRDYG